MASPVTLAHQAATRAADAAQAATLEALPTSLLVCEASRLVSAAAITLGQLSLPAHAAALHDHAAAAAARSVVPPAPSPWALWASICRCETALSQAEAQAAAGRSVLALASLSEVVPLVQLPGGNNNDHKLMKTMLDRARACAEILFRSYLSLLGGSSHSTPTGGRCIPPSPATTADAVSALATLAAFRPPSFTTALLRVTGSASAACPVKVVIADAWLAEVSARLLARLALLGREGVGGLGSVAGSITGDSAAESLGAVCVVVRPCLEATSRAVTAILGADGAAGLETWKQSMKAEIESFVVNIADDVEETGITPAAGRRMAALVASASAHGMELPELTNLMKLHGIDTNVPDNVITSKSISIS